MTNKVSEFSPIFREAKNFSSKNTEAKMPSKSKKTKAAGRFGARYGRSVRSKLANVEQKQRQKQECPFCKKSGVKRISKGIWECSKCGKKFASDIYYLKN